MSDLVSSSIAALCARTCTHWMDTVKVRVQTDKYDVQHAGKGKIVTTIRNIAKTEGIGALWRGLGPALVFSVPALSCYLWTYDQFKHKVSPRLGLQETSPINHLVSAFAAETVSAAFWTPMEVLKEKLQAAPGAMLEMEHTINPNHASPSAQVDKRMTAMQLSKFIWNTEGFWKGFMKGYWISLVVFVPQSIIQFVCYERFKTMAARQQDVPVQDISFPSYLLASGLAGCIAGALVNPLDVVKTRYQVAGLSKGLTPWLMAKSMMYTEGWRSFTKGTFARMLWVAPNVMISLSVYESLKRWFKTSSTS
jgi:hypothetical protein